MLERLTGRADFRWSAAGNWNWKQKRALKRKNPQAKAT